MLEETALDRPRMSTQRAYIPTLDGWRALAVLLVIGTHCQPMLRNSGYRIAQLLADVLAHSGFGVDVFFTLSGFLIGGQLIDEKDSFGTISLKRFYLRRIFRILPPMIFYLAVISALGITGLLPIVAWREVLVSITFIRNYVPTSWYTGHFWSLSIEEHFYAFMPLLILMTRRRFLLIAMLVLIAACCTIRAWELAHLDSLSAVQFRTESRIDGLLWGAVMALTFRNATVHNWLRSHLDGKMIVLLLAGVILISALLTGQGARRTLIAFTLPFFIGFTILHPESWVGRVLEQKPVRMIGRLSYSLYIWQMAFLVPDPRSLGAFQAFPLALITPVVLAIASYNLLEKPMIRIGHRIAGRRLPSGGPAQ